MTKHTTQTIQCPHCGDTVDQWIHGICCACHDAHCGCQWPTASYGITPDKHPHLFPRHDTREEPPTTEQAGPRFFVTNDTPPGMTHVRDRWYIMDRERNTWVYSSIEEQDAIAELARYHNRPTRENHTPGRKRRPKWAVATACLTLALAASPAQAQTPIDAPAGCTLTHYWADDGSAIATCSDGSKVIAHDADGQWVEGFPMREPGTWYGLR